MYKMLDSYNAIFLNKTTFFATFAMLITSFHCMTLRFVEKRWILSRSTQDKYSLTDTFQGFYFWN